MFNPVEPSFFIHPRHHKASGARIDVINPATLAIEGVIAETTPDELQAVLAAATSAQRGWKRMDAKSGRRSCTGSPTGSRRPTCAVAPS